MPVEPKASRKKRFGGLSGIETGIFGDFPGGEPDGLVLAVNADFDRDSVGTKEVGDLHAVVPMAEAIARARVRMNPAP